MKTYSVSIPWHCDVLVIVEAESEDEALLKAETSVYPCLCHQCSEDINIGERNTDAEPTIEGMD